MGIPSLVEVFIIERQLLFGKAVAKALTSEPRIHVAGISARREDVVRDRERVDVVVIDVDDVDDIDETFGWLKAERSTVRICALSAHAQPDLLQHCLSAGADAYIVKDSSLQELITAILVLGSGSSYVDPRVAADYFRRRIGSEQLRASELSPRERDIIRLIAQGLSNRDIGRRLALSEKTVKNHVSHIFSKLHFTTRSQAAVHAIRNGLA